MAGLGFAEVIMVVVVLLVRVGITLLGVFALLGILAPERMRQWRRVVSERMKQYRF